MEVMAHASFYLPTLGHHEAELRSVVELINLPSSQVLRIGERQNQAGLWATVFAGNDVVGEGFVGTTPKDVAEGIDRIRRTEWRLVLAPSGRPFSLTAVVTGEGFSDQPAPTALVAHVERTYGQFDSDPIEFQSLDYAIIKRWPQL